MWTMKPAPIPVQLIRVRTGAISVVYSQHPSRNYDGINRRLCNIPTKSQTSESESESIGGLGQQILLRSGESNPNNSTPKEKEMRGSDVLWAIQRATAQRKRSNAEKGKKKKITGLELSSSTEESTGGNVRPLRIKNDWGHKLDEFEKLLKEFEDTEL